MVNPEWIELRNALADCLVHFRTVSGLQEALRSPWDAGVHHSFGVLTINHLASLLLREDIFDEIEREGEFFDLVVTHPSQDRPVTLRVHGLEQTPVICGDKERQQAEENLTAWLELVIRRMEDQRRAAEDRSKPPQANPPKTSVVKRGRKTEARDGWIYRQCLKGREMPYVKIIAELKRQAAKKGWSVVSTPQRIQQISREYAERHGKPPPPARQGF
jgi:hypothetical protein